MKKGEIWLVRFPEGSGSKQSGSRPAIIIRRIESTDICIAVPLTSSPEANRLPYVLQIPANKRNCLLTDSVALVFQLTALDVDVVKRRLGALKDSTLKKIDRLLADMLLLGR